MFANTPGQRMRPAGKLPAIAAPASTCRKIEQDNYLVACRRAVSRCLFADEVCAHRSDIERNFANFLTPAERKSASTHFDPPIHATLGLIARARLNLDARDPVVAKVIRAKPVEEPAEPSQPAGPPELGLPATRPAPLHEPRIVPPFLPGA